MFLRIFYVFTWGQQRSTSAFILLLQLRALCHRNPDINFKMLFCYDTTCVSFQQHNQRANTTKSYKFCLESCFWNRILTKISWPSRSPISDRLILLPRHFSLLYYTVTLSRGNFCQNTNNYTLSTVYKRMTSTDVTIKINYFL